MLTHLERKVLTIIRNTNMRLGHSPSILMIHAGHTEKELYHVEMLAEQKYIEWNRDNPENLS